MRLITLSAAVLLALALPACDEAGSATTPANLGARGAGAGGEGGTGTAEGGTDTEGGGTETEGGGTVDEPQACDLSEAASGTAVVGRVYVDSDGTDESLFHSAFEDGADEAVDGVSVELVGVDGGDRMTCDGGQWAVGDLSDGVYLAIPKLAEGSRCASRNCPTNFHRAALEASEDDPVQILTIGDSIPVQGDAITFPTRLQALLSPVIPVVSTNKAIGGSTSPQWLPGTSYFDTNIAPYLAETDLLVASLGGNDLMAYAQSIGIPDDIEAAKAGAIAKAMEALDNVLAIADAVHAVNPDIDIAYLLYIDYGLATSQTMWSLVTQLLGPTTVTEMLIDVRASIPAERNIVLVDLFEASRSPDVDVNSMMADPLHMNSKGHTWYAERIFETLGGVLVGADTNILELGTAPLGLETRVGLRP